MSVPPLLRRPGVRVATLFTATAVVLFHDAVLLGRDFFFRDLFMQWRPQAEVFVRSVVEGSLPLWNPYASFGQPMLGNPNFQVLYPFTWLHLLVSPGPFYTAFVVCHFVLAGVGTYAVGRHLRLSRGAATVAGLLWSLSGPFLSLVNLWNHMAAAAWLPWVVLAGDRAVRRFSWRASLAWGTAMGLTVLAGSPETALMGAFAGACLAVRHLPAWLREPRRLAEAGAAAAAALVFSVALSAGQWVPALDVARHSQRASMPASAREYWSVDPWVLLQVGLPVFPDRLPLQDGWSRRLYEGREAYLGSLYLGLPAAGLVFAGLRGSDDRRRWAWGLVGMALLSTAVALGPHTPVYGALTTLVAPLRALRFPAKLMVLASFGWALVAGLGVDRWRDRPREARLLAALVAPLAAGALALGADIRLHPGSWAAAALAREPGMEVFLGPVSRGLIVCGALTAVVAVLALVRWRGRPAPAWVAPAVGVVAMLDLAHAHWRLEPTAPRGALDARPASLAVPHGEGQRIFVFDYAREASARRLLGHAPYVTSGREEGWEPWQSALALAQYPHPYLLGRWARDGSFSRDAVGLFSADVATLNTLVDLHETMPGPMLRLLRLAAVDTVVALHAAGFEELTPVATLPSLFPEPIRVFRVTDPLPRAYAVGRARIAPVGQGWRALLAPDFDPAREIVLPEGPVLESEDPVGTCRIVERRTDRVEIEARLDSPAYVVLVDTYDEGWEATIDDAPARVLRANVAFRAVETPAGTHRVRFVYRPRSATIGVAVSAVAALAGLSVALAGSRAARGAALPA